MGFEFAKIAMLAEKMLRLSHHVHFKIVKISMLVREGAHKAIMSISRLSKSPCSTEKEPTEPSCQFQDCQSCHARQRRSPQSHHVHFKIVKITMLVREGAHRAIMSISRLSKSPCSTEKEPTEPSCQFQDFKISMLGQKKHYAERI